MPEYPMPPKIVGRNRLKAYMTMKLPASVTLYAQHFQSFNASMTWRLS